MSAPSPVRELLSIGAFLDRVHREVLRLTPREYLAAERLMRSRRSWSKDDLKASLASLLARSDDQWQRVAKLFDDFVSGGSETGAPPAVDAPEEV